MELYGKVNVPVKQKQYAGVKTSTATTNVNNTTNIISVDVNKLPHSLEIIKDENTVLLFDGSNNASIDLTPYLKKANSFNSVTLVNNILNFFDQEGNLITNIELSPFVQEQSNLAETNSTSETFVRGKETKNLVNNGDANPTIAGDTTKYATEKYVEVYGGKIDSISVNNTAQTIDQDKNVNITVPTATSQITNDSDFTTQTYVDGKLNKYVLAGSSSGINLFSYNGDIVKIRNNSIHLKTGNTYVKDETVQLANSTTAGLMSYENFNQLNTNTGNISTNSTAISNINAKIPNQATSENQLADKNFVNSSISTNTANFIGTFANIPALNNYSGTITNNDYAFVTNSVITDNGNDWADFATLDAYDKTLLTEFDYAWVINGSKFDLYRFDIENQIWNSRATNINKNEVTLNTAFNRYKYSNNTWIYEYTLNNSSFTAAQWAAINSGITADSVAQIETNRQAITTKQDALTAGTNITISGDTISATDTTYSAGTGLTLSGTEFSVNNTIERKPTEESYIIASNDWTALSSSDPYIYSATVTATYTIGNDTEVGIVADQPVLFANYGFVVGAVSGQNVTIYATEQPETSVTLTVSYRG